MADSTTTARDPFTEQALDTVATARDKLKWISDKVLKGMTQRGRVSCRHILDELADDLDAAHAVLTGAAFIPADPAGLVGVEDDECEYVDLRGVPQITDQ